MQAADLRFNLIVQTLRFYRSPTWRFCSNFNKIACTLSMYLFLNERWSWYIWCQYQAVHDYRVIERDCILNFWRSDQSVRLRYIKMKSHCYRNYYEVEFKKGHRCINIFFIVINAFFNTCSSKSSTCSQTVCTKIKQAPEDFYRVTVIDNISARPCATILV